MAKNCNLFVAVLPTDCITISGVVNIQYMVIIISLEYYSDITNLWYEL